MYIKNQKFLVVGVSKSGCAVAEDLLKNNSECYIYEQLKSEKISKNIDYLVSKGAILCTDESVEQILSIVDAIVLSPGVPINHQIAVKAKRQGVKILGELEYGYLRNLPTIVGITGTNGKTTTCSIISQILNNAKIKNFLLGNVGQPLTSMIDEIDKDSVCVTEVSSFQLESVYSFCPHISCITNIAPDHLERHYTMDNYIFLKKRIFKMQRQSEYCILNYDDEVLKEVSKECLAKIIWVSLKEKVDGGYLENGVLYYKEEKIIEAEKLNLIGEHNLYNVLYSICVCKLLNVSTDVIAESLIKVRGVKHRIEKFAVIDNVEYYNDSKSTNVASTLSALQSIKKPIVLILGGSEKGENYDNLFENIKLSTVKHVILTGASKFSMLDCAGKVGYTDVTVTPSFEYAVKISKMIANDGEVVLLSPACSSFDNFTSYEERGEKFMSLVRDESEQSIK